MKHYNFLNMNVNVRKCAFDKQLQRKTKLIIVL